MIKFLSCVFVALIAFASLAARVPKYRLVVYEDGSVRTQKIARVRGSTNAVRRVAVSSNRVDRTHHYLVGRRPDVQLCEDCFAKVHGVIVSRTVDEKKNKIVDVYEDGAAWTNQLRRARKSGTVKPQRSAESRPEKLSKPLPTDRLPPGLKGAREKANAQCDGVTVRVVVPNPLFKEEN